MIRLFIRSICIRFAMSDSTEYYCLFEVFSICHCAHAHVTDSVQTFAEWSILDSNPTLLIKHIHMNII